VGQYLSDRLGQPFVIENRPGAAYAKANPGKLNMASSGTGSGSHVTGELFKMMAGVDMIHLPHRGGAPALTDLIGGRVQIMFDLMTSSIEHIRAGKVRLLAVTTAMRSEVLPDLPSVGDFVPGYEASSWSGVGAPKNTPSQIIDKLNEAINAGLADPKVKARLADLGGTVLTVHRPTSASSSPTKPRNGARW
jgi:tripartite-type tricarboxylate transporter receptor subunit TctC